jgi:pimeloyl-ACP methyl ester carboxylesterase
MATSLLSMTTEMVPGPIDERTPITDDSNPFNADEPAPFTYTFSLAGQVVTSGATIEVVEQEPITVSLSITKDNPDQFGGVSIFRQEGSDYRSITQFSEEEAAGRTISTSTLPAGEYVAVLTREVPPILMGQNETPLWKHMLQATVLPLTAHAYYPDSLEVIAIPFTISYLPPPPAGASSVLFLPGIMGSRLYEQGAFCDEANSEKQLWFSTDACRQFRLTTDFVGGSINQVYTKPGVTGILDEAFVFNTYKSFLRELSDWKKDQIIADYAVIPYDWRGGLDDVLRSAKVSDDEEEKQFLGRASQVTSGVLYDELAQLAASSKSGKVTIIGHSNGGLVAKHLIDHLQKTNDPLVKKIDNLILVAVPQAGAPNAAIGILHGEDMDPVMSQTVTRRLMNTMPFSHHLLPNSRYFELVETPVIRIESGEATDDWVSEFGNSIADRDTLHHFLSVESGRTKPELDDLATPEVVDGFLLNYAKITDTIQSSFIPTDSLKVYQIAGTGLETVSELIYFSDRECVASRFFICTEYQPKISYRVRTTIDGDETVLVPSALGMKPAPEAEQWWVNLFEYNDDNFDRRHRDILEIPEISDLISRIVQASSLGDYEYLSKTQPTILGGDRLVFQLHSPLDLSFIRADGREVSSTTNEIDTATYRRYGELQYLSIPQGEVGSIVLRGVAPGSFTLDIEEVIEDQVTQRHTYSAIPSSIDTIATVSIEGVLLGEAIVAVDHDGDGQVDVSYNVSGIMENKPTYDDLLKQIELLDVKKAPKSVLTVLAKVAQKLHDKAQVKAQFVKQEKIALQVLLRQVLLYTKLGLITEQEKSLLMEMLNYLLKELSK